MQPWVKIPSDMNYFPRIEISWTSPPELSSLDFVWSVMGSAWMTDGSSGRLGKSTLDRLSKGVVTGRNTKDTCAICCLCWETTLVNIPKQNQTLGYHHSITHLTFVWYFCGFPPLVVPMWNWADESQRVFTPEKAVDLVCLFVYIGESREPHSLHCCGLDLNGYC